MSRILHHVGRNDFKKTRQRQIGEQKERAAQKLKEWQEAEAERKQIEEASRPYKSNWRRENLREFGEWAPIETSGPTNSTSTTFGYFAGGSPIINGETGQQVTFTYSGLNGVENYPTTVTIDQGFGDTFQTAPPPFSQIGVQGYTAKLNPRYAEAQKKYEEELKEWERKKEQQQKDIEATLKSLGTSLRDMQKNAGIARVGNSYVALMPGNTTKYDFGSNLMNNIRIVRLVPYDSSKPMELARNVKDADGKLKNWNVSNSQISNDIYLGIGEPPKEPIEQEYLMPRRTDFKDVNPQLDASQEFAQKVGADEFMNARVDVPPDPSVPLDYNPPEPTKVDPYADRILELNMALDKMKKEGTLISRYKLVGPGEEGYVDTTNMANAIGYNRKPIYTAPAQEMFAELERLYELQLAWLEKQNPGGEVQGADDALDDYNRSMGPNSEPPSDTPEDPNEPVPTPDDDLLDQLAKMFGVGSAKNFLDHYADNFVKGDGKQDQNLTNLLSKNDRNWLKNALAGDSAITNPKRFDNPQDAFSQLMQRAPRGIRNSIGNGAKLDMDHYRRTGDFKIDKSYVFTQPRDFEVRTGNRVTSNIGSLGTVGYARSKAGGNPFANASSFINNPMRFHVIIPGPKKKKKSVNESTWSKLKKYR